MLLCCRSTSFRPSVCPTLNSHAQQHVRSSFFPSVVALFPSSNCHVWRRKEKLCSNEGETWKFNLQEKKKFQVCNVCARCVGVELLQSIQSLAICMNAMELHSTKSHKLWSEIWKFFTFFFSCFFSPCYTQGIVMNMNFICTHFSSSIRAQNIVDSLPKQPCCCCTHNERGK